MPSCPDVLSLMQPLPRQDSFVSLKGNSLTTNAIHFTSAATTHGRFVPISHPNESACKLDINFDVGNIDERKEIFALQILETAGGSCCGGRASVQTQLDQARKD